MSKEMKELLKSQWTYILYDDNGKLLLSVVCGKVGLFDRNIYLNPEELSGYHSQGEEYIKDLAEVIRNKPSDFDERHVNIKY